LLADDQEVRYEVAGSYDHKSYENIYQTIFEALHLFWIIRLHEQLNCLEDDDDKDCQGSQSHGPIDDVVEDWDVFVC